MKIHIIYDNRRSEKYPLIIDELMRQGISDYQIWDAVIDYPVVRSIAESHKRIVKYAKDNGLVEILIAEDDICFPSENGFKWFLKNKPPLYDIYTSCNYIGAKPTGHRGSFRADMLVGFQLYSIHSRYYDTFLATPDNLHIDSEQKSKLMYYCYPHAAIQRPGFSANHLAQVNYNNILNDCDVYGGKPK